MAKRNYIRTPNSGHRLVDFNLSVAQHLKIPVFAGAPSLFDNPDEAGAIGFLSDTAQLVVYLGGGVWAQPGADMSAVNAAITTAINNLVNAAPGTLDTLKEIADAFGDDPNFAATITGAIANVQGQVTALSAALIPHPTYTAPSVPLTSSQTTAGLEIGQTINIPLTVGFNQNDGGAEGAISLKKDGTQIATAASFTDSGVVMSLVAKVYQANVAYAQGPVKIILSA